MTPFDWPMTKRLVCPNPLTVCSSVSVQSRRKMAQKKVGGAKKENLDDLKQELDIDYHKITQEELYQRFQTHPENVSVRRRPVDQIRV